MTFSNIERELARGKYISVVDFVSVILQDALLSNTSDIHIDPSSLSVRVRFRIDGILKDATNFPIRIFSEVIARIKILAHLRTDERKMPQDGRFSFSFRKEKSEEKIECDVRVSCVPTHYGESIVMRLLANTLGETTLELLGFSAVDRTLIEKELEKQSGMILATGPTGSGKTTTLYSMLKIVFSEEISIVTIEDPVEYALAGVKQIQTQPVQTQGRSGLNFANGLRSVLRQDPDVIMVGEIRDTETAQIAINTALTGHLLLSTLHTSDAATAIPRFLDMGIEPFLVASTLRLVIAQRLVRRICLVCRVEREVLETEREMCKTLFQYELRVAFRGGGCDECGQSGFSGRVVVAETLLMNEEIQNTVMARNSAVSTRRAAIKNGMTPMIIDGLKKVEEGLTTLEELISCIHE